MAYLRGSTWYVDVSPPGLPRIQRSTRQDDEALALAYEDTLRKLAAWGRHRIYRAVAEGDLAVSAAYAADQQGTLHELEATLSDRPLKDAIDGLLALWPDKCHRAAVYYLRAAAPAAAASSWLLDARNMRKVIEAMRAGGLAGGTENHYMDLLGKLVRVEFGASTRRELFMELRGTIRPKRARERYLSREEVDRLKEHAGDWRPHIELSLATGIRRIELRRLKVQDVDFENGQLRVFGKGNKWRKVSVPDEVLALLRGHIARTGTDSKLFPGATDKRLTVAWRRIREAAGLEDVHWHDMRRTFGVTCARNRVPLSELKQYMGHSSVETTVKHYGTYVPDGSRPEMASAMAALGFQQTMDRTIKAVK